MELVEWLCEQFGQALSQKLFFASLEISIKKLLYVAIWHLEHIQSHSKIQVNNYIATLVLDD